MTWTSLNSAVKSFSITVHISTEDIDLDSCCFFNRFQNNLDFLWNANQETMNTCGAVTWLQILIYKNYNYKIVAVLTSILHF